VPHAVYTPAGEEMIEPVGRCDDAVNSTGAAVAGGYLRPVGA
jgi:hypothetical protein